MQNFRKLVKLVGCPTEKILGSSASLSKEKPEDICTKEGYRYLSYFKEGVSFCIDSSIDIVHSAYLYGLDKEVFSQYKGNLPADIKFGDTETTIVDKLGTPSKFSAEENHLDTNSNGKIVRLRYSKGSVLLNKEIEFYIYPNTGMLMLEVCI